MARSIFGLVDSVKALEEDVTGDPNGYIGKNARGICDAYGTDPSLNGLNDGGALDGSLQRMCAPYYDEQGVPPPQEAAHPLVGGQCDTLYRLIEIVNPNCEGTVENTRFSNVQGPISTGSPSQISERPDSTDECPKFLWRTTFTPASGNTLNLNSISSGAPGWRAERMDGLPDECGNQEPDSPRDPIPGYPNPRPWGLPTVPGTDPSGDPYTYTPRRDPATGAPWIEIDGPEGPVGLPPFGGDEPDMSDPSPDPQVGDPFDVDGSGGVDADPEDEETKPVLLGYRFTVRDNAPQFQSVIPNTSPRIYSRVVGSIQLKLRGESGTFYSDNLQITSEEGSIVKQHPTLVVVGCVYNVLPALAGLTLREIRGKDDDS